MVNKLHYLTILSEFGSHWVYHSLGHKELPVVQWLLTREMDTVTRFQIPDDADYISQNTDTLGKGMNLLILPPSIGEYHDRLGSPALVRRPV